MTYNVYVIRLKPGVWEEKAFAGKNPGRRRDKPCVYVGSTAHTPEKRAEQHRAGGRLANRFAHRYFDGLHAKITANGRRYLRREAAERAEAALAERLRRRGYGVWYGVRAASQREPSPAPRP